MATTGDSAYAYTGLERRRLRRVVSQSGDAVGWVFTTFPTSPETDVPDAEYRILLLLRVRACRGVPLERAV